MPSVSVCVSTSTMSALAIAFVRRVTASASRTAGSPRSDGTRPSGTCVKSATSGSARNVSASPAASARRTVNASPAPCAGCMTEPPSPARGQAEAEAPQHADDVQAAARGGVVAEVRNPGVRRAEADLRDDAVDVGLEAHRVRVEDPCQLHPAQELARVGADRYAGGADREAPAAR